MAVTKIVRKDKDGKKRTTFRAEVWVDGNRVAGRLFDTIGAAHEWHDRTKGLAVKGYLHHGTFNDCVLDYLEGPFQDLQLSTRQGREPRIRYFMDCPISNINLSDLAPHHITMWLGWLKTVSTDVRRKNFHEELALLGTILNWHRETRDPSFVVPILRQHREKGIEFRKVESRRPDYYVQADDLRAWLDVMSKRRGTVYYQIGFLMFHTGLRLGEAAGLCWDMVNLCDTNPTIRIQRTLSWDKKNGTRPYFQPTPKNESSERMMKIPRTLAEMLKSMKSAGISEILCDEPAEEKQIRAPLFLDGKGKRLRDSRIRYHFDEGFKKLGLEWHGTHIARHTLATLSLQATGSNSEVQAVLGHKTEKQTQQYAKVISMQFGDALQKTADLIGGQDHAHFHAHEEERVENVGNNGRLQPMR